MIESLEAIQSRISEIKGRFYSPQPSPSTPLFSQMLQSASASGATSPRSLPMAGTAYPPASLPPSPPYLANGGGLPEIGSAHDLPILPVGKPLTGDTLPLSPMSVDGLTLKPIGPAAVQSASVSATDDGPGKFDDFIEQAAEKNGVESALVRAVIHAESDFNPKAVSKCGAQGLMQLMPGTARALGVKDSFDPAQNINGGTQYLRHLLDQFGDVSHAVAAYNAGPGSVKRYGGVPPFAETQAYVKRVEGYLQNYRAQGK
jgi:hypothetical protein